jgi:hypothetical protein
MLLPGRSLDYEALDFWPTLPHSFWLALEQQSFITVLGVIKCYLLISNTFWCNIEYLKLVTVMDDDE